MSLADIVLVLLALGFAWSMGAHYTGACMGMPHASGSIGARAALWTMAPLTLLGATLLSHGVLVHVGHGIVAGGRLATPAAIAVIAAAFALTTLFTQLRIPTSTIQILVFCIVGAAAALGLRIHWGTIARLALLWVLAPVAAFALGYAFTRLFDRLPGLHAGTRAAPAVARALVVVGGAASVAMGANDVSNATAVFLSTELCGPLLAGFVGGLGLAAGVLTWGRPLLRRVAFDMVRVDLPMATAAQLVQALVVLTAVAFGYFTSMNQALIGAMAGTGVARGRETIDTRVMLGVVRGWLIGPAAGALLGYLLALASRAL
ncbi:MAG: anion permease [Betaproteobacteria bacterium]|nr:inorganic phosphate transporter family protein [Betaproteobacteria bacterium]MBU6511605.1 inorganic phosphate transporter family protein [Betaproteobacteria bacterium]MDE1955227.1 anion permease [Betaproteobacteria bacterium]MDE2153256.1 anion permease [Betaproteobacteria bacterium]MDE2479550.1 anion permease [Betaproteobacteria bacterium]